MDEYSRGGTDDSGLTKFEVSIYYDIFKKKSQIRDPDLIKLRSYFRKRFAIMFLVSLAFLGSLGMLLHDYF